MKILLLGGDGQLGRKLRHTLVDLGEVVSSSRHGGDIACDVAVQADLAALLHHVRPELIVNAAAYTNVDGAQEHAKEARTINADVPARLGTYASANNAAVIHYSTDYVFDGSARRPYRETDPTGPINEYGASKLEGEERLAHSGCPHLILRTAWLYGPDGRNFFTTMLRLGRERTELNVVNDQVGTPTSVRFVADATQAAARRWMEGTSAERLASSGVYHLTATGHTTWHGFASAIMKEAVKRHLLPVAPTVHPIQTATYPTPARRPAWSVMDTSLITERFDIAPPSWEDDLPEQFD